MKFGVAPLLAVLAVAVSVSVYRYAWLAPSADRSPYDGNFVPLASSLYRQGYMWPIPWAGVKVDVHAFLLAFGEDYVLIDVGAPGQEYAEILLKGLDKALGTGKLRLVLLTHGHADHVGALEALVQQHPQVQVAFHEAEATYLTGDLTYNDVPADHDDYRVTPFNVSAALPAERVLHLRGSAGDVADGVSPSGNAVKWLPPRGALRFQHTPGHSPGLVAYLHKASNSMVAGDVITHMGSPPALNISQRGYTANITQALLSAKAIADLEYERAYCAHDAAKGVSRLELQKWAHALQAT